MLLDVVALIPPSSKGFKQVLLLQIQENGFQSLVSLFRTLQHFIDGHSHVADREYFWVLLQLGYHWCRNKANLNEL